MDRQYGWAGYVPDGGVPVFVVACDVVSCFQDGVIVSSSLGFACEARDVEWCAGDAIEHGIPVLAAPDGWDTETFPETAVPVLLASHAADIILGTA